MSGGRDGVEPAVTEDTPGAVFETGGGNRGGYWRMPTIEEQGAASLQAQMASLPPDILAKLQSGELIPDYTTVSTGGGRAGQATAITGIAGFHAPSANDTTTHYDLSGKQTSVTQNEHGGGGWLDHAMGAIGGEISHISDVVSNDPIAKTVAAIGVGVLTAGAGTALGASLMDAGILTSAADASAAVLAADGTEAAAAAAASAATATATAVGTATVNAGVQIARGVPADQALGNAVVNLGMSQVITPAIAADVKSVISTPLIANTVTNMGTSIVKGIATGQGQDAIINSAINAATGTVIDSAASDILKNTPGLNDPSIPPEAKQVALAGITGALTTGDGTKSMVNAAIAAGTKDLISAAKDVLHPTVLAALQDTHDTAVASDSSAPAADTASLASVTTPSDAVQNDFNSLVASGVDPDTALSTVMDWHASGDTQQVSDNTPVDDSVLPTNNQAVASGMGPGSVGAQEAAAGNLSQDELAAAQGVDTSGLDALTPVSPNQAVASGMGPGSVGAQEAAAGNLSPDELAAAQGVDTSGLDTSGLDALNAQNVRTAGSSPGSEEAATRLTDPKDLLAADAGDSGSLPTRLGNEAVASGMSPGSVGAQAAADNSLLDSQLSAAYGTSNVADLTGGNTAANNLEKSSNEAVASGMSPGSAGAAQAAAGMLTDNQLAAATGTNNPVPSPLPTVKTPTTPAATTAGALPTTNTPSAATTQSVIPGQLLHLGKMGSDMTPHQLKQLYADITSAPSETYTYDNSDPADVNVAQMNAQPFTTQPMYAHGGLVQHFGDGGTPDPAQGFANLTDFSKSLQAAADAGKLDKIYRPTMLVNGTMGGQSSPRILPQLAAVLRARGMALAEGGQPDDHLHPEYDGTPVFRTGGLEGLGGKYVEGKGDGTSDDITAMLANGEYVFSADVVAALGNGSNKAGAEKLNEMVHAIRARARSAPPDKLSPDAKSPLEYLKSSKGKKNG